MRIDIIAMDTESCQSPKWYEIQEIYENESCLRGSRVMQSINRVNLATGRYRYVILLQYLDFIPFEFNYFLRQSYRYNLQEIRPLLWWIRFFKFISGS